MLYEKVLSVLASVAMLLTMLSGSIVVPTSAETATTEDGFAYEIVDGTATITDYTGSATEVVIPIEINGYAVTAIGEGVFSYCWGLSSVTIPDGVTSIGAWAFSNCIDLTSATIPDSVTSIGGGAFWECTSLTSVTIPDSVTTIEGSAFLGCTSLVSVTIGDSVTSIGRGAFSDCTSLISVTISDGVTSIGENAFYNTAYYNDSDNWENGVLYIGHYLIGAETTLNGAYTVKDDTKCIGSSAFSECKRLTSVTIPDSVTSIGGSAFYVCISLTSVMIPDGVTSIGVGAFSFCTSLTSVTIPDSVTSIGDGAFSHCTALTDVYYLGSESDWAAIAIGDNRTVFGDATIHYNSNGPTTTTTESMTTTTTTTVTTNIPEVIVITITDSDTAVSVSAAEGVIDVQTVLSVELVSEDNTGVCYDITLVKDGEAVQPDGEVTVSLPVPEGKNGNNCKVYFLDDHGDKVDMNAMHKDGKLVFVTTHFSKYAIEEVPTAVKGDLNGDDKVTIMDAVMLYYHVNGKTPLSSDSGADMNGDGKINISDAVRLYYFVNGKIGIL